MGTGVDIMGDNAGGIIQVQVYLQCTEKFLPHMHLLEGFPYSPSPSKISQKILQLIGPFSKFFSIYQSLCDTSLTWVCLVYPPQDRVCCMKQFWETKDLPNPNLLFPAVVLRGALLSFSLKVTPTQHPGGTLLPEKWDTKLRSSSNFLV